MRASSLIVVATWALLLTSVAQAQSGTLGSRVLQQGETGDDVKELQQDLKAAGFDPGTLDGTFGAKTEQAVRSFQGSAGLTVDGVVGSQTVQALENKIAALANAPSSTTSPAPAIPAPSQQQVSGSGTTCSGVDVSSYDGTIDWAAASRAGVLFAIARCADGQWYEDSQFPTYWTEMKAHGIVRGVYQYFRAGQDPIAQADLLISKVGTFLPGDLPPFIDCETLDGEDAATFITNLRVWLDRVKSKTGLTPIIYTTRSFWHDDLGEPTVSGNKLWVANWNVTAPHLPDQWSDWLFWQNSATGTVDGIGSGNCDLDVWNGSLADLLSWANSQAATQTPATPSVP